MKLTSCHDDGRDEELRKTQRFSMFDPAAQMGIESEKSCSEFCKHAKCLNILRAPCSLLLYPVNSCGFVCIHARLCHFSHSRSILVQSICAVHLGEVDGESGALCRHFLLFASTLGKGLIQNPWQVSRRCSRGVNFGTLVKEPDLDPYVPLPALY